MPKRVWRHFDVVLLVATILLIGYGVAMIFSAVSDSPGLQELPQRQAIYAGIGLVIMFLLVWIDYRALLDLRHVLYIISLALLALVLIVGSVTYGSQRWLDLGAFPIQPSEIAKLLLIVTLAAYFARRQESIASFRTFAFSLLYILPPMALIFAQPDLSTGLSLGILWIVMAFVAGIRMRYLIGLGFAGLLASPLLWVLMADYQRQRIQMFIDPASNPAARYNLDQALISIGSGGWFGKGFALGSQSQLRFLRVRWSDFIFSVIGEELGMAGILVLFILFVIVIWRLFVNAGKARDLFGQLVIAGVGGLILFQSTINIGMNLGVVPATGIPLPFVSSGGSSLITFMIAQGLVQSINLRRQKIDYPLASRV
jgi:rod shape determining protein RodA